MPHARRRGFAALLLAVAGCAAADAPPPAAYQPQQPVEGEVRIWGAPEDGALLRGWAAGFEARQPHAHVTLSLHGPESTMAGVYNGVADLALLPRELREPVEDMAFTWVYLYKPYTVEVANAGLRPGRPSTNLVVYVNRDNPLPRMDLAQLDGVFGAEHRRGAQNLRSWGELGLDGDWKQRSIHVYGPPVDSIQAIYLRTAVLQDSYKWNGGYRELPGDGAAAVDAVAADPEGIAFGPAGSGDGKVKVLPLAAAADGPYELPTAATIAGRTYPLARVITMVLNRAPGKPIAAGAQEFLRYVLSGEGQAVVAREGSYIPLASADATKQLAHLQ